MQPLPPLCYVNAKVELYTGELIIGRPYLLESLALRQKLGLRTGVAHALVALEVYAIYMGDYEKTRGYANAARELWVELGFDNYIFSAEFALGVDALHLGEYGVAHRQMKKVLAKIEDLGTSDSLDDLYLQLGKLALVEGDYEQARLILQKSLSYAESMFFQVSIIAIRACLALAERGLGNQQQAHEQTMHALNHLRNRPLYSGLLQTLPVAALLLADSGWVGDAVDLYNAIATHPYNAKSRWFTDVIEKQFYLAVDAGECGNRINGMHNVASIDRYAELRNLCRDVASRVPPAPDWAKLSDGETSSASQWQVGHPANFATTGAKASMEPGNMAT